MSTKIPMGLDTPRSPFHRFHRFHELPTPCKLPGEPTACKSCKFRRSYGQDRPRKTRRRFIRRSAAACSESSPAGFPYNNNHGWTDSRATLLIQSNARAPLALRSAMHDNKYAWARGGTRPARAADRIDDDEEDDRSPAGGERRLARRRSAEGWSAAALALRGQISFFSEVFT